MNQFSQRSRRTHRRIEKGKGRKEYLSFATPKDICTLFSHPQNQKKNAVKIDKCHSKKRLWCCALLNALKPLLPHKKGQKNRSQAFLLQGQITLLKKQSTLPHLPRNEIIHALACPTDTLCPALESFLFKQHCNVLLVPDTLSAGWREGF